MILLGCFLVSSSCNSHLISKGGIYDLLPFSLLHAQATTIIAQENIETLACP